MKTQINEIKRMQQLSGIIKESQMNEEAVPFAEWKQALKDFIEENLTNDYAELEMLADVLKELESEYRTEYQDYA